MKAILASSIFGLLLIAGAVIYSRSADEYNPAPIDNAGGAGMKIDNVSVVDDVQIVELQAKGGYWPRKSVAQAGVPTILRFNTKGTFDCSSYIRIPSLKIAKALPQTGQTDIDLGIQEKGVFRGSCGMGMYPFEIEFI
jgi:hypothetical protein